LRTHMAWMAAGLIQAAVAAPLAAQLTATEQLRLTGTVEAVAAGRLTVRDNAGGRVEVRVQAKDERGVALADGTLLAFPAEIEIAGVFEIAKLKPGQMVRFHTRLNRGGKADADVGELTLVDADEAQAGVTMADEPKSPADFADCEVTAAVKQASKSRLVVQLPETAAFHRKTTLSFRLAKAATGRLTSSDPRRIEPGAKIVSLDAVRLNTGDVVAKSLVVENIAGTALEERGDDALANKYRGLSAEPKQEPRLIRSPHFAFLSDVSDREARIILDKLERMAGLLDRYFGRGPRGVVEGFVVHDLAVWPAGTLPEPDGVAKIREQAGVCFNASLGDQRKATLYSCADHGVIQHECTHGFCHLAFGSTGPTWLAEGVAEMGNYWREGQQAVDVGPGVMAYLQKAEPKRGLLEIAVPGRTPSGTWQDYAWRWALCHMLANNPNYADRFKPLAIALMEERPDVSFESVYGPVAREVSFEYDQFLKTVGNGFRADLAAWPWKAKFRALPAGGSLKATVRAAGGWQASGLRLEQGVTYELTAEGTWRTAQAGQPQSAAGDGAGHGGLVGAVFHDYALGAEIPLGSTGTFVAPSDGQLFLRCADDWTQLADNDGALTVSLRRAAAD
jgi:hypothetical protein